MADSQTLKLTDVEIARRRMLFALLIEHEVNNAKLHNLSHLNVQHGIGMPATWVASSVSSWEQRGWVKKMAMMDGSVRALLLPGHYGDALELILDWLGAGSLTVDPASKAVASDVPPPTDLYLPPSWQWFQYADSRDASKPPVENGSLLLSDDDAELARVREALGEAIEAVRGDNGLEQRDEALSSLRYADDLLGRAELTLLQVRVGLPMLLDDALTVLGGWAKVAMIETVKALTVEWIRKRLGA